MEPHVDESEDPPIDDTEDPDKFLQRSPSKGDVTACYDGMKRFINSVPPDPSYGDASIDDGASSSQGTQDAEQDHEEGLVDFNEQPVEPDGQDEPNRGGAQEGGEEEAAGGGFVFDLEGAEKLVIFDALDHPEEPVQMVVIAIHEQYQFRGPYVG